MLFSHHPLKSSFMSHLYILIGPPKTATTSLQVALESAAGLDHSTIRYHGVLQPRNRNNGKRLLASRLHSACRARAATSERAAIRKELNSLLASSSLPVVISEEMFLVSEYGLSWKKKLENLSQACDPATTTLVIALRDPNDGLRSYYREILKGLPLIHRVSFGLWCRCDKAQVFNYASIDECASSLGFRVAFFDMSALKRGKLAMDAILGEGKGFKWTILDIGCENVDPDKVSNDNLSRYLPSVVLHFSKLKKALALPKCSAHRWAHNLNRLEITIRPAGLRRLIIPHNISRSFHRAYQAQLIKSNKAVSATTVFNS